MAPATTGPAADDDPATMGAWIMLGTLFGLIVLIFALVLKYDPEACGPSESKGPDDV
jgi:hypothetical protein